MQTVIKAVDIIKFLDKYHKDEDKFQTKGSILYVVRSENVFMKFYKIRHKYGQLTIKYNENSVVVEGSKETIELIFKYF